MNTEQQLQTSQPTNLIAQAIEKGADIQTLEKLMALQERWEASQARKLFFEALNLLQSMIPELRKSKSVKYTTKTGFTIDYKYAPLSEITKQIKEAMRKTGLSYRWEISNKEASIEITCIVTHSSGHSEKTTMSAKADDSGNKNAIQSIGSTTSYLQRYTLIGALGISSADSDTDGELPKVDIDKLHKEYMSVYDQLIQIDSGYSKYDPDNWKGERTAKNYVKATGELRKILSQVIPGKA